MGLGRLLPLVPPPRPGPGLHSLKAMTLQAHLRVDDEREPRPFSQGLGDPHAAAAPDKTVKWRDPPKGAAPIRSIRSRFLLVTRRDAGGDFQVDTFNIQTLSDTDTRYRT